MELSGWTEVMQERFQMAYPGMREKQHAIVCRNSQYYKPIMYSLMFFCAYVCLLFYSLLKKSVGCSLYLHALIIILCFTN